MKAKNEKRKSKGEKVGIIGAGNVGAALAQRILENDLANVVLLDIDGDISRAKAYDLEDAAPIMGHEKEIIGTSDYADLKDADIVVITAGFARKPGMSREDLTRKNGAVVKDVSLNIKKHAPGSIIIVVTNPLDVMSYVAYKASGFDRRKVIGMAGALDASRHANLTAHALNAMRTEVESVVIGSHDGNMIPLPAYSKARGRPLKDVMDGENLERTTERTKKRGAEIVSLLKTGSAFFAPSAACLYMIKSILRDELLTMCASVYLDGEYGLSDIFIGVPIVLGKNGIKEIVTLELTGEEAEKLKKAAEALKAAVRKYENP